MTADITVAPTGPIATKADTPAAPTSPDEIAAAVDEAYREGATVAHIHLCDEISDRPLTWRSPAPLCSAFRTAVLVPWYQKG